MGPTPKPSKRRRTSQSPVPMLPVHNEGLPPSPPANVRTLPTANQTRIPSGPAYEQSVTLPTLPQLLEQVAGREDDGYFKLCPGNDGKSWYLTYRWRWGQWGGHYVMAVVPREDLHYGLILLAEKVAGVRAGYLRPTKDRFGD